jgi:hypothetical protein
VNLARFCYPDPQSCRRQQFQEYGFMARDSKESIQQFHPGKTMFSRFGSALQKYLLFSPFK